MIKEYFEYLNNNPKGYWFKSKLYGWGWVPVTWQGWLVILVYVVGMLSLAVRIGKVVSFIEVVRMFVLPVIILTGIMIWTCYKTGEKPQWRWGLPKNK